MNPKPDPEAVLVESGMFRVDRERALEKLRKYQLPHGTNGMQLLLACASARGAGRVSIRQSWRAVEVRFDGTPFQRARLEDPYSAFFEEEGAETESRKLLSLALLAALRTSPRELSVVSGPPGKRARLSLRSLGDQTVADSTEPGSETVFIARWRWGQSEPERPLFIFTASHSTLSESCGLFTPSVELDGDTVGKTLPVHAPGSNGGESVPRFRREYCFRAGGRRIVMTVPNFPSNAMSLIHLYKHGIFRESAQAPRRRVRLYAWVDDPGLALNASMSGIVKDDRRDEAILAASDLGDAFLLRVVAEQKRRMLRTGRLLAGSEGLQDLWNQRFTWGPTVEQPGSLAWVSQWIRSKVRGNRAAVSETEHVLWDARVTLWLREACKRLIGKGSPADAVLRELFDAPIYFDAYGSPLSLADLRRIGGAGLRYTKDPSLKMRWGEGVIWCFSSKDTSWLRAMGFKLSAAYWQYLMSARRGKLPERPRRR